MYQLDPNTLYNSIFNLWSKTLQNSYVVVIFILSKIKKKILYFLINFIDDYDISGNFQERKIL